MFKALSLVKYLFIVLLLSPFITKAHTQESSNARLTINDNQQFVLAIDFEASALLNSHFESSDSISILTAKLSDYSLVELKALTTTIKDRLKSELIFYSTSCELSQQPECIEKTDTNSVIIESIEGFTVAQLKQWVKHSYNDEFNHLTIKLTGILNSGANSIQIAFPAKLGNIFLTYSYPKTLLVSNGLKSAVIDIKGQDITHEPSSLVQSVSVFVEYVIQGYLHILPLGIDHILFVLALFLLANKPSTLIWQVSAFTLAHTITLALGIYGVISISGDIVEPLIALSIAFVAIENLFKSSLSRWRLPVVFGFGLLHGLGFASVLLELGLAQQQFLTSLIAFNIGVEIGQLTVILGAFVCVGWAIKKAWYHNIIVKPASLLISIVALYWFITRLSF